MAEKKQKPENKAGLKKTKKQTKPKKKGGVLDELTVQETKEEQDAESIERGDSPMSIVGHLNELRTRLIKSIITILVITLASFFVSEYLLTIIEKPILATGVKLNVFNLTEGFMLRCKSALIAGIMIGLPVFVFEVWKYIKPAVNANDRKFIRGSIIAAVFLFYGGIAFTYFLLLPAAVNVLLSFTPKDMANIISATTYLNFIIFFCLALGLIFELPIVIMILTKMGIVTPQFLTTKRKYAIVIIWIVAAVITPTPDMINQTIVAVPMMILYEISIIISKIIALKKKKQELAEASK